MADSSADEVSDLMEVASVVGSQHSRKSDKSRKSSSTLSSLLSNKSLELVFGLIDDYYQGVYREQPSTADLLGNFAPSATRPSGDPLGALAAAADVHDQRSTDTEDVIARAMAVAEADGKRLEELLVLLTTAQSHASATACMSRDQLQRLETELAEIKSLLSELKIFQRSLTSDTRVSTLAPKLAALAHWQECVLNNALVARMRIHTGPSPVVAGPQPPTASEFIEQRCAPRPSMAPPHQGPSSAFPHVNQYIHSHTPMAAPAMVPRHPIYPAYNRPGFVAPRTYSLDNKIEMHGGGANAHDRRDKSQR